MQMLIKKILEHALFLCKERGRDMFQHSHVIYKGSKNERTIDEVFIFYTTKKEKKRKKNNLKENKLDGIFLFLALHILAV